MFVFLLLVIKLEFSGLHKSIVKEGGRGWSLRKEAVFGGWRMESSSDRRQRKVWESGTARAMFPLLGNGKEMAVAPTARVSRKPQMWQGSDQEPQI